MASNAISRIKGSSAVRGLEIVEALHIISPFATVLFFLSSKLANVVSLRKPRSKSNERTTTLMLICSTVIFLLFTTEAGIITSMIFNEPSPLSTQDSNIYAFSGALVWMILGSPLLEHHERIWLPFYGSWIVNLSFDTAITVLSIIFIPLTSSLSKAAVIIKIARALIMSFSIALFFYLKFSVPDGTDEECAPLLHDVEELSKDAYIGSLLKTDDEYENSVIALAERDAARRQKKKDESQEAFRSRLQEDGNWFKYISGFSVFVPHIVPYKDPKMIARMVGVGFCLLLSRGLNLLIPRQLGIIISMLNVGDFSGSFRALVIFALLSLLGSSAGISALKNYIFYPVEAWARMRLSVASYNHIMELSCDFHDEKRSGELYTSMHQGDSLVDLLEIIIYEFFPLIIDVFVALGYFYILFDSYIVLMALATIVCFVFVSSYITAIKTRFYRLVAALYRRTYQTLFDTMGEWKTVAYFNRINHCENMYKASVSLSTRASLKQRGVSILGNMSTSLVFDIGRFGALFYALYQVTHGRKDIGSFVTLMSYWNYFTNPLTRLLQEHNSMLRDLIEAEELLRLFRTKPSVLDGPNELQITEGKVEVEGIRFKYKKNEVIQGLSFTAEPGKTIALIGETGAGKSTILKLVFRFFDVSEGMIKIDGQDIRNVTLESLRDNIGVVPQDSSLFNDTIIANLRYARLDATDEDIFEACKAAAIHEKILTFPEGYFSRVGEHGVLLSGGELQRISIARAILKNPKIILLDEATSSVDNETEEKIQEGLQRLCQNRTTFVVAHRLSTIMEADKIIVLKDGKILEEGTPAELFKSKGKYYKLWSKQMGISDALANYTTPDSTESPSEPNNDGTGDSQETKVQSHEESESTLHRRQTFRPDAPEFVPGQNQDDEQGQSAAD